MRRKGGHGGAPFLMLLSFRRHGVVGVGVRFFLVWAMACEQRLPFFGDVAVSCVAWADT